VMKGVDAFYQKVSGVGAHMSNGVFETGNAQAPGLVLGSGIENALNMMSDRTVLPVTVYLPKRGVPVTGDPMAAISTVNFQSRGAFAIQQDFDNKYVISNLGVVKEMIGLNGNEYSAAEIKMRTGGSEKQLVAALHQLLGDQYLIENRYQQNRSLFSVMQLEKWAIYGILCLILVIAAFNLIGSLTMLVLEKQQDIQILKAMGASDLFIQKVFLSEGMLLAFVGGVLGTALAILFCYLQVTFKLIPLEGSFVIDYYPVKVLIPDLLLVFMTIFVISVLAAWIPSAKAARQQLTLKAQ
jgi:lipoprotein-releasing system permease protein